MNEMKVKTYKIICDSSHSFLYFGEPPHWFKRWLVKKVFGWRYEFVR
jgi:hypothetical protein